MEFEVDLSAPLKHFPYLHDLKHSDDSASRLDCRPPSTLEKNSFLQEVRVAWNILPANCWAFRKEEQESHRKMTQAQGLCLSNKERQGLKINIHHVRSRTPVVLRAFEVWKHQRLQYI